MSALTLVNIEITGSRKKCRSEAVANAMLSGKPMQDKGLTYAERLAYAVNHSESKAHCWA